MDSLNAKRKLNTVSNQGDKIYNKAHKRHHSDHAPLSSINHQAAQQLRNRNASGVDKIANISTENAAKQLMGNDTLAHSIEEASRIEPNSEVELTSRPKQPIFADAPNSSADKTPSLSFQKAKTTATPKRNALLDEENASLVVPATISSNTTSKLTLLTPSSPPLEETLGEEEESENAEGSDDEGEDGDVDDGEEDDEDHLDSDSSSESSIEPASDAALDSDGEPHPDARKKETFKADNPSAFASSMAGILGYKLTRTQRANPILARSATAKEADETLLDMKLEKKAKAEMKKEKFKKGGVGSGPDHDVAGVKARGTQEPLEGEALFANQQQEKELRKMAQKGVIKMFNAFTAVREKTIEAQALRGSRAKKEEKATEMSKEGWLEYIGQGGKGKV